MHVKYLHTNISLYNQSKDVPGEKIEIERKKANKHIYENKYIYINLICIMLTIREKFSPSLIKYSFFKLFINFHLGLPLGHKYLKFFHTYFS